MSRVLFVAAVVAVGAVLLGRRWRRHRDASAWRGLPGRSPESPLPVARFDEMDATVSQARCTCGGRLAVVSEGSASTSEGSIRVLHVECGDCEAEYDFFFDLSRIEH